MQDRRTAVVTGASSGIGAATAVLLTKQGFRVFLGARRKDRVAEVARRAGGPSVAVAHELDVADQASIERFVSAVERDAGHVDLLINNAGLALGLTPVAETPDHYWTQMWEINVLGLLRTTKLFLPLLRKAPSGHIVNLASIAAFENYKGGAGYTATKHAVRAITRTLRLELNGEPIRITEISPGLVETEFSLVRFEGDREAAAAPYKGLQPLTAEDIADCIVFAVTRPPHVDIDEMVIRPVAQAATFQVARKSD